MSWRKLEDGRAVMVSGIGAKRLRCEAVPLGQAEYKAAVYLNQGVALFEVGSERVRTLKKAQEWCEELVEKTRR